MIHFGRAVGWGLIARAIVSAGIIVAVAWQAPVVLGIAALAGLLTLQLVLMSRFVAWRMRVTGRDLRPGLRRLAIELVSGVAVSATVIGGTMWAGWHYG